jgi:hypothetical protein
MALLFDGNWMVDQGNGIMGERFWILRGARSIEESVDEVYA